MLRVNLVLPIALIVLGCTSPTPTPHGTSAVAGPAPATWRAREISALTADERAQFKVVEAAQKDLMTTLFSRLETALERGDVAHAIDVCQRVATELTDEVGTRHNVRIGRTSFKRRNPANVPPAWMNPVVDARTTEPVVMVNDNGVLAAALPITLKQPCLRCHGNAEHITPDVDAALRARYPNDQARGFAVGDLRGWVWVEVDAPRKP